VTRGIDWTAWSREAVHIMQQRNEEWIRRWGMQDGTNYEWSLKTARLVFQCGGFDLVAGFSCIGSTSSQQGTFRWSWANPVIPEGARQGVERVRSFGLLHDLELLTTPEWPGGRTEALEMVAIAGRILDAAGVFVAPTPRGALLLFVLLRLDARAR
jgi:hypothetical protein